MAGDVGMGRGYEMPRSVAIIIMAFLSIALYNVVELTVKIFTTFRKWHGLYFYALLVASWGIIPYSLGFAFKFYNVSSSHTLYNVLIAVGWPCMVTGQSVVLYSRLHLITRSSNDASRRWVLGMIITNAIICHIPITVLTIGSASSNPGRYVFYYAIGEKIQVTIFFLQEIIISGIYVHRTARILRDEGNIRQNTKKVMKHLIWVNIIIIAFDASILGLEYAKLYNYQTTYKAGAYSIKLKMEFSILNRLMDMVQGRLDANFGDRFVSTRPSHVLNPFSTRSAVGDCSKSRKQDDNATSDSEIAVGLGNSAYAKMDDETLSDTIPLRDIAIGVLKTTEVSVQSVHLDRSGMDINPISGPVSSCWSKEASINPNSLRRLESPTSFTPSEAPIMDKDEL